jgi:2'-5' RNA ligase
MTERWRCFVAIPLGGALRAALSSSVDRWRADLALAGLRWTSPGQWHVTVAFLGSVPQAGVPAAIEAVHDVAGSLAVPRLATGGLGAFPSAAQARVVWYGVSTDESFSALAGELRRRLGLDADEPLRPHVTLARARTRPVDVRAWLEAARPPTSSIEVEEVHVMRSHLGRGPARYEVLAAARMGGLARV